MSTQSVSRWCPDCEQWVEHIGSRCVKCDVEDLQALERAERAGVSLREEVKRMDSRTKDDWMEADWVVSIDGDGPDRMTSAKKDGVQYICDCEDIARSDLNVERVRSGLYRYGANDATYYVGRPSAFVDEDLDELLTP